MNRRITIFFALTALAWPRLVLDVAAAQPPDAGKSVKQLQEDFRKLKFGMLIHYNMATYKNTEWVAGYHSPADFDPGGKMLPILFQIILGAVPWIGEVDASTTVEAEIIGCIQTTTGVVAGQRCHRSVVFKSQDCPCAIIFAIAANHQSTLCIKVHAIGASAGLPPDFGLPAGWMVDKDTVFRAV